MEKPSFILEMNDFILWVSTANCLPQHRQLRLDLPSCGMETHDTLHLVAVERVPHSLLLYFSDGRSGVYSDALLYSILNQAEQMPDEEESPLESRIDSV